MIEKNDYKAVNQANNLHWLIIILQILESKKLWFKDFV